MDIKERLLSQGKDITNKVIVDYILKEELDWEKRKIFFRLKEDAKPTLADMIKYNYRNMLKDLKMDNVYLYNFVSDLEMYLFLKKRDKSYQSSYWKLDFLDNLIINDRIDIFKQAIIPTIEDNEGYNIEDIYEFQHILRNAMLYSSKNILEYSIKIFPIRMIEKEFKHYIYFISRDLRDIFKYTDDMKKLIDKYRPNFFNDEEDIKIPYDKFSTIVDMVNKNKSVEDVFNQIYDRPNPENDIEAIDLISYLLRTKNKYVFELISYIIKREESINSDVKYFTSKIVVLTNDYILGKRLKNIIKDIDIPTEDMKNNYQILFEEFFNKL